MQVVAAGPALLGCLGGAAIGAAVHAGVGLWRQQGRETVVSRRRSFWKVRLGGDASLIAKARGLASRTGATIRRVSTGAFEVRRGRSRRLEARADQGRANCRTTPVAPRPARAIDE